MRRHLPAALLVIGLAGHLWLQAIPAWNSISRAPSGRDFASYYYALQVSLDGGDPYDTAALSAAASDEHTRRKVHPFFYPPPFLWAVVWARTLSLFDAYKASFVVNEVLLGASLLLGVSAFGVPIWAVALLLWTWSPIPDNAWMGQANLFALVPALAGLALATRGRPVIGGVLVGSAAMLKMSPALFLVHWALRRQWRAVAAAVATALLLSIAALPLVPFEAQRAFYLEILPGFSKGDYHGLTVPISLPANHSIPDLFDRLFPSDGRLLSESAQRGSQFVTVALLGLWAWRARHGGREAALLGALTVLMVAVPVYTYEHHLVFLLVAVGTAAGLVREEAGRSWGSGRRIPAVAWWMALTLTWFVLAWPLSWLRAAQAAFPPEIGWLFRESKTLGEALLFALLLLLAGRAPQPLPAVQEK